MVAEPTLRLMTAMDVDTFVATVGCAYVKAGGCPPFHLRAFAEGWAQHGISLYYCLAQIRDQMVTESKLPWLDRQIRAEWHRTPTPPRAKPLETSRLFRCLSDPKSPTGSQSEPEAAKAIDRACAFLREELGGGEVETEIVEAHARDAGVAIRTLDRARKRLCVISRRSGFGAGGKAWLSLP